MFQLWWYMSCYKDIQKFGASQINKVILSQNNETYAPDIVFELCPWAETLLRNKNGYADNHHSESNHDDNKDFTYML